MTASDQNRPMISSSPKSKLLVGTAALLIVAVFGLWAYVWFGWMMLRADVGAALAGGQEPTFLPIAWEPWHGGRGDLTVYRRAPQRFHSATIVAHRIGRSQPLFFYSVNVYQAKYQLAGNAEEIWFANGPLPDVETDSIRLYAPMAALMLAGLGCIYLARRAKPEAEQGPKPNA
jgi:hypothetical protein